MTTLQVLLVLYVVVLVIIGGGSAIAICFFRYVEDYRGMRMPSFLFLASFVWPLALVAAVVAAWVWAIRETVDAVKESRANK